MIENQQQLYRVHAICIGKVQGVGFRWSVVECAEKQGLHGTVQNLTDGSVEIFAEGKKSELELFLQRIHEESGVAKIVKMKISYQKATHSYLDFRII